MKEMAADKGLKDKELQELLKDRARGEKAFELVSIWTSLVGMPELWILTLFEHFQ